MSKLVTLLFMTLSTSTFAFEPTWESLDSRRPPTWYDETKIGIIVHFGVYSTTVGSEWFWMDWLRRMTELVFLMQMTKPPSFTYQDFANEFKAELFDATAWAKLFDEAGAKNVI